MQGIDLTVLDEEPIHICGQIQPHGVLLVLEEPALTILQVSSNTSAVFGISPENLIQRKLEDILDSFQIERILSGLAEENIDFINTTKLWVRKKVMNM